MFILSRITSCVLVQAIMQNPLLNDYVKRGNRGMAGAMQKLGFVLGEILAFVITLVGVEGDRETQDMIYYGMSGGILVVGLFVTLCMVRERKVKRNYAEGSDGVRRRQV